MVRDDDMWSSGESLEIPPPKNYGPYPLPFLYTDQNI
jgi:hypothetical protein